VIVLFPSLDGADHDTNAIDDAGLAATPCGAEGAVGADGAVGVTALDGDDSAPAPAVLDACTTNVYDCPGVNPPIVALVAAGAPVAFVADWAVEPRYGVTVYVVAGPPDDGADHDTDAPFVSAAALTPVT
jgi:hypothetical protein